MKPVDKEKILYYIDVLIYSVIVGSVYFFFGGKYIPFTIVFLSLLGIVGLIFTKKRENNWNNILGFICSFSWCCVWILALLVLYGLVFFIVDAFKVFF